MPIEALLLQRTSIAFEQMKNFALASITTLCLIGKTPDNAMANSAREAVASPYHNAWSAISEHYLFTERLKNWKSWEHKFDGKLKNRADTRRAIEEMIGSLKDEFTYLVDSQSPTRSSNNKSSEAGPSSSVIADNNLSARTIGRLPGSSSEVTYGKLKHEIGYIRIPHFKKNSVIYGVRRALTKMADSPGYVVDLRGNQGGYVDVAYDVFGLFTDEDKFTEFYGRNRSTLETESLLLSPRAQIRIVNGTVTKSSRQPNLTASKPVAVLIDKDTRSAAEMLAGALRDGGRAVLVGTSTFGKGVLQDRFEIGAGMSVKIVTARYFLPLGESIHGKGIRPNKFVWPGKSSDAQLLAAMAIIKQSTSNGDPNSAGVLKGNLAIEI